MLSIQPLKSARGAAEYYTKAFDYYASDAEAMVWLGKGKEFLKLGAEVDKETMLSLLEGRLPSGQVLCNPNNGAHRPGFDMTFSAPKSLSILVGLGISPELVQFHDKAVRYAVSQLEAEFAETRVRHKDEIRFEKTGNLLVAAFRQPTSRANDPSLHTHCVTMNLTFFQGKAKSLASDTTRKHGVIEQIQNNAHYGGLLYRQHLANQLKEAGFHIRLTGDGLFEIDGVPETVLHEFSRRREDIERLMEEKGWQGAKSSSTATLLSREGKELHDSESLHSDWLKRAENHHFNAKTFSQSQLNYSKSNSIFSTIKAKLQQFLNGGEETEEHKAKACVSVAIETLSQRHCVFTERALLAESMKHSLVMAGSLSKETLSQIIAKEKHTQGLYEGRCPETGARMLTTPWALTLETETLARIEANKEVLSSMATLKQIQAFQKERQAHLVFPMTESQKEAMAMLLTSKDRYLAVQGYAGVAKTTMLSETRLLMEEKGYRLRGITVASSAAHELAKKGGIQTDVFPVVLQELKDAKRGGREKWVYIVDEASMLSSPQGHELIKQIERTNARLILVGDRAQLPSVNTGRIFSLTQDFGIETTIMDEIVRQNNQTLKEAVYHATKGEVRDALDKLDVQELATHEERIQWIADKWLGLSQKEREETLLFAPTHANREAITELIRNGLIEEGSLGKACYHQDTLKAKPLEPIQLRFAAYYQKGDVLRLNQDFKSLRIRQGTYFTIGDMTAKHRKDNVLPLVNDQGKQIIFPLKLLPRYKTHTASFERIIEVYQPKKLELRKGDKVMWTRNFKAAGLRNGEVVTLHDDNEKALQFLTKEGEMINLDKAEPALKHLDYSFVLTNYKVQGKDAPFGIGLMESYHQFGATLKNFYVQISRAIQGMTLVTDNREQLIGALHNNKDEKIASIDVLSREQLKYHENRFLNQTKLSIKPVIEKMKSLEQQKELNQISELNFSKQKHPNIKPLQIKELEL
ncbi:conjugative transfer protein TraI [Legionella donaldsonii]|uniref:Conjugative transfer protein TraI n=1 Tax=Legionella donaldsonii TaxID=45060 RepID=A0A378J155_9GAMM|nr:MobF family relaxase [Legionella donaldsonii]STX41126.1 conjugative transfer protein TraI [Legionella donaldsonii]